MKTNKKYKLFKILGGTVGITAILGILFTVFTFTYDRIKDKSDTSPKVINGFSPLSSDTTTSNSNKVPVYTQPYDPLRGETGTQGSIYKDGVVVKTTVANPNDYPLKITGFEANVSNIRQDNSPNIVFINDDVGQFGLTYDVILRNEGWGESGPISVTINDQNNILSNYFSSKFLTKQVNGLRPGEEVKIHLLNIFNRKSSALTAKQTINYSLSISNDGKKQIVTSIKELTISPSGFILFGGEGGDDITKFGILVKTNNNKFYFQKDTTVIIPKKSEVEFEIFLFPDRSCLFDLEVLFSIEGVGKVKSAKETNLAFTISYYKGDLPDTLGDGAKYNIINKDNAFENVFFPFNDEDYKISNYKPK